MSRQNKLGAHMVGGASPQARDGLSLSKVKWIGIIGSIGWSCIHPHEKTPGPARRAAVVVNDDISLDGARRRFRKGDIVGVNGKVWL